MAAAEVEVSRRRCDVRESKDLRPTYLMNVNSLFIYSSLLSRRLINFKSCIYTYELKQGKLITDTAIMYL